MTKVEFLEGLRTSLAGEIPLDKIKENINYYEEYINQSISGGKSEEKVLEEIGDSRLIARTIIDTYKLSKGPLYEQEKQHYSENREDGSNEYYGAGDSTNNTWKTIYYSADKIPWYKKLAGIIVIAVVLLFVLFIAGFAIRIIFSIAVPIILLMLVFTLFTNLFHRR